MNYDDRYACGGFHYRESSWFPYMQSVIAKRIEVRGKVLDAPCGDGFWSKMLESIGCQVTATDLSRVGAEKAGGICWNLEELHPNWIEQYDWVFSRAISHLHKERLDTRASVNVFENLCRYARKVLVIYWTDDSGKAQPRHFCHSKVTLDSFLSRFGTDFESFFHRNFYHAIITAKPERGLP